VITSGTLAGKGSNDAKSLPAPVQLTADQDHQRLMDLLHIAALRPGADGNHPDAPNAANYDESKANPIPGLPGPTFLKFAERYFTMPAPNSSQRRRTQE
jgi:hypothetical protein